MSKLDSVAVFCGSSEGNHPLYVKEAQRLGAYLAEMNITLVYGGAQVGCMGAIADACLRAGGRVIGVIPEKLRNVEIAHHQVSELHVVKTMHERKAMMADLSDAFIALPGGAGTLEEWFEVFTWAQIGYHEKPCSFLNINDFYNPLLAMLDHTINEGFMRSTYRDFIITEKTPETLIAKLEAHQPRNVSKWS
ncbi:TIGR00730 family Rossman fold protein [Shouchella shacheensis]|uniref:LOG family protein n=1 Tax=Shouchella shacheensis TaxID=1649580 RepID=UPI00074001AC|nr:TIGR00730 family Rossman fold protein [Shouchella shacheensis]